MNIRTDTLPDNTTHPPAWREWATVAAILLTVMATVVLLLVLGGDQQPQPTTPMPPEGTLTGGGL